MDETGPRFFPGDRVRIREDIGILETERPDQVFLVGTKGSVGVIVSVDEFRKEYENYLQQHHVPKSEGRERYILGVKETMEKHFRYPVRFVTVESSGDADALVCCKVGEIELIYVSIPSGKGDILILEKIE